MHIFLFVLYLFCSPLYCLTYFLFCCNWVLHLSFNYLIFPYFNWHIHYVQQLLVDFHKKIIIHCIVFLSRGRKCDWLKTGKIAAEERFTNIITYVAHSRFQVIRKKNSLKFIHKSKILHLTFYKPVQDCVGLLHTSTIVKWFSLTRKSSYVDLSGYNFILLMKSIILARKV